MANGNIKKVVNGGGGGNDRGCAQEMISQKRKWVILRPLGGKPTTRRCRGLNSGENRRKNPEDHRKPKSPQRPCRSKRDTMPIKKILSAKEKAQSQGGGNVGGKHAP